MMPETFGQRLRRLRKSRGFDQLSFAIATGYANASPIAKIEKGRLDVRLSTILTFARVLNYPAAFFFYDDPDTLHLQRGTVEDISDRAQLLHQDMRKLLDL